MLSLQRGLVVLALALITGAAPAAASATDQASQIVSILHGALNASDVEGVVELFAEDAVVVQLTTAGATPRVFVGRDQIRWWARSLAAQHAAFDLEQQAEIGADSVVWKGTFTVDSLRQIGIDGLPTSAEAVVKDGLVTALTIVPTPAGARRFAEVATDPRADMKSPGASSTDGSVPIGGLDLEVPMSMCLSFALGVTAALGVMRRGRPRGAQDSDRAEKSKWATVSV